MTATRNSNLSAHHAAIPSIDELKSSRARNHIADAWCTFPSGTRRRLVASQLSAGGVFIVTMMPPQIASTVQIVLLPTDLPPLPNLQARVVETRLDPSAPWKTGFRASFFDVSERALDALIEFLVVACQPPLDDAERSRPFLAKAERRHHPRVPVSMSGRLHLRSGAAPVDIWDLSIGGALAVIRTDRLQERLEPSDRVVLEIPDRAGAAMLHLPATVARVRDHGDASNFGLQFEALDEQQTQAIEDHILATLAEI